MAAPAPAPAPAQSNQNSNADLGLPLIINENGKEMEHHWKNNLKIIIARLDSRIKRHIVDEPDHKKKWTMPQIREKFPKLLDHVANLFVLYKVKDNNASILTKALDNILFNYKMKKIDFIKLSGMIRSSMLFFYLFIYFIKIAFSQTI